MSLHVITTGRGPRLVLLHGWALNSHVWEDLTPRLAQRFTVVRVDLPGHGASSWPPTFHDLESLARALMPAIDAGCAVLGWSLGALAALELAALRARDVIAVITVAGTPKFVQSADWPYGVEPRVLDTFAEHLQTDFATTVREFLALQVRGDERAHTTLRALRREVLAARPPDPRALAAGLDVLRHVDLRERLREVRAPALVIAGERDRLTPPEGSRELAAALPRARFHQVERAAHAPFLSHAEEFLREVEQFLARVMTPHVAVSS
jgi:pimeloyl-[acyl-carrier protein] methyl ester esterase